MSELLFFILTYPARSSSRSHSCTGNSSSISSVKTHSSSSRSRSCTGNSSSNSSEDNDIPQTESGLHSPRPIHLRQTRRLLLRLPAREVTTQSNGLCTQVPCDCQYIERNNASLATSPEFLLTASHVLVVWRYDLDFTRQKSGYYGPDRSRPRDDGTMDTGGQMEAYAILSWLSVNASLSYLLRGQLR